MTTRGPHVIVGGAGVGGLTLAQGLHKAGVSVAVHKRDRAPDAPPGLPAQHRTTGQRRPRGPVRRSGRADGVYDEGLRELMQEDPRPVASDPQSGSHAVSRTTLRRVLLAGLDDVVIFDKQFVRYTHDERGRVTAWSADGSSATDDLLVGADGAGSRVRRQLLPHA